MKVQEYYDKKASTYNLEKTHGFLSRFVQREQEVLQRFLDIQKGDSVLDVGCGEGFYSRLIREKGGEPFGVDISPGMIASYRREGFEGAVLDIVESGVDRKFHKVFCGGSLEFTSNPELALRHMSQSLEMGNSLVLLYPRLNPGGLLYRLYHLSHGMWIHLFSDQRITAMLHRSDLEIVSLEKPTFFAGVIKAKKSK